MTGADGDFDLKKSLMDKSIEAYVLALETINRLSVRYRLETFCYLLCNAWELLLKAKIIDCESNPDSMCAVERRCVPAGANPARQLSLQPEAVGAVRGGNELD